jgi:hypothetical protein
MQMALKNSRFPEQTSQHITINEIHKVIHMKTDLEGFINDENIMHFQQ